MTPAPSLSPIAAALLALLALMAHTASAVKSAYFIEHEDAHIPSTPGQTMAEWEQEARANLTKWRNNLFMNTMLVTKQLHEARVKGIPVHMMPRVTGRRRSLRAHHLDAEHPWAQAIFQLSNPFISCPPPGIVTKLGGKVDTFASGTAEDGHKYICNASELKEGCSVLSIGSRGDTSFEAAVLASTPCTVITLDCTLKESLQTLGARHTFYPLCLGSAEQAKANPAFVTLPQLMQKIGKERVDLLKMDIEGFEWDVLASLGTEPGSEASLPTQMAIELHVTYGSIYRNSPSHLNPDDFKNLLWPKHAPTLSQVQLMFLHIVDLGYGITSRDDNPLSPAGGSSEFVFHRVPM